MPAEIEVVAFDSLLINFARSVGASLILRGCAPSRISNMNIRWRA